ncbi:T9SS type A sorting domain-containing protein [Kaistella sp. G5-32]|uniref:T9SS type A sorting domain-containing protein n=1 Tax=Kaistella gelatinilytica TaxID=2787636 RepID=A0ABS0F872_9FLAO|nr:T9SS type A sorting domain-containing protein [Kaistella gelatinilytica]MBF8455902.1 T9SS type A sorting domain-containing protein [Kaistella gelatinilytica]
MKKIYILILGLFCFFASAQPYSILLKNANWTITKIQWSGVDHYPPVPFTQSGKVAFDFDNNNGFKSTFFNTAGGKVTFGANNAAYFTLQNVAVTLAEYYGENEQAVRQFDSMATAFYFGFQTSDQFTFQYEQIFSGKNLIVTNKYGNKIFYSNLILGNNEVPLNNENSIYPNPAKNEIFLRSSKAIAENSTVEIFDNSGKLISTQKILTKNSFSVQMLQNGVYTARVSNLAEQYSSRFIIKK